MSAWCREGAYDHDYHPNCTLCNPPQKPGEPQLDLLHTVDQYGVPRSDRYFKVAAWIVCISVFVLVVGGFLGRILWG